MINNDLPDENWSIFAYIVEIVEPFAEWSTRLQVKYNNGCIGSILPQAPPPLLPPPTFYINAYPALLMGRLSTPHLLTPFPNHQQNVKTTHGPPRGVMVPLVLLIHPDPPWSTFLVKFEKVWIRMDQSRSGGPRGPQPRLVDQEPSGPPWTTVRYFPNARQRLSVTEGRDCGNR